MFAFPARRGPLTNFAVGYYAQIVEKLSKGVMFVFEEMLDCWSFGRSESGTRCDSQAEYRVSVILTSALIGVL